MNRAPLIRIVTPALADANNGNWRTAHRWQILLSPTFKVIVQGDWTDESCDILIALHARRSAAAIVRFRMAHPTKQLIVVLTGTDLYRDLKTSEEARQSLDLADSLIVLQEDAIQFVPLEHRKKTHVVYQSAKQLTPEMKLKPKQLKHKLNCVVVGHLRDEKDPATIFHAAEKLGPADHIHILHIGAPLDEALAATAQKLSAQNPHYHWSGAMAHGLTRAAIKRAHVLIHPSIMEGGANVIVEALTSGTPVIASKMSGNVGMLGQNYEGYFPVGDEITLVALLKRCVDDANFMSRLSNACQVRAKLFLPETERNSLCSIANQLLHAAD
jgi:putative glycosyltransferase (TIGR04348 family)